MSVHPGPASCSAELHGLVHCLPSLGPASCHEPWPEATSPPPPVPPPCTVLDLQPCHLLSYTVSDISHIRLLCYCIGYCSVTQPASFDSIQGCLTELQCAPQCSSDLYRADGFYPLPLPAQPAQLQHHTPGVTLTWAAPLIVPCCCGTPARSFRASGHKERG